MKLSKIKYIETEQNYADAITTRWYDVEYYDQDEQLTVETLGYVFDCDDSYVVDSDNWRLVTGDYQEVYFRKWLENFEVPKND